MGIAPDRLDSLFYQSGSGVGLHGCALAARELGAELTASSEGHGRGALFVLELPPTRSAA